MTSPKRNEDMYINLVLKAKFLSYLFCILVPIMIIYKWLINGKEIRRTRFSLFPYHF